MRRQYPRSHFVITSANSPYSTRHFLLARRELDVAQCADLISMQTLLCMIIFLITTSRMTSAYTYLGITCTSALRLGLHKEARKDVSLTEAQQEARIRIMLAVLQLDTLVSVVLDMPARINPDCLDSNVLAALQPPSTKKKPSVPETVAEPQAKFAASAKHLQILSLTATGLRSMFSANDKESKTTTSSDLDVVDLKKTVETEEAFRQWAKALSSLPLIPERPELSSM